jgi:putative chitinase
MTPAQLRAVMPYSASRPDLYAQPLTEAAAEFGIDTPKRLAAWIAQIAHESGELRYVRELASGGAYEGRRDLGNTQPGDGPRFRGRGLLQITGRANYAACGTALGIALLDEPELLERPIPACRSAGWFWQSRSLNRFADSNEFGLLTRAINGGYTGLDDRISYWLRARKALGL